MGFDEAARGARGRRRWRGRRRGARRAAEGRGRVEGRGRQNAQSVPARGESALLVVVVVASRHTSSERRPSRRCGSGGARTPEHLPPPPRASLRHSNLSASARGARTTRCGARTTRLRRPPSSAIVDDGKPPLTRMGLCFLLASPRPRPGTRAAWAVRRAPRPGPQLPPSASVAELKRALEAATGVPSASQVGVTSPHGLSRRPSSGSSRGCSLLPLLLSRMVAARRGDDRDPSDQWRRAPFLFPSSALRVGNAPPFFPLVHAACRQRAPFFPLVRVTRRQRAPFDPFVPSSASRVGNAPPFLARAAQVISRGSGAGAPLADSTSLSSLGAAAAAALVMVEKVGIER